MCSIKKTVLKNTHYSQQNTFVASDLFYTALKDETENFCVEKKYCPNESGLFQNFVRP